MLHSFAHSISTMTLPKQFTYPFHYTPHPLCVMAATEVQAYLQSRSDWQKELQQGKMFGVLVVKNQLGEIGFLAACSGILAGKSTHAYFVPPIYDLLQPNGFFKIEEEHISAINQEIAQLETDELFLSLNRQLTETTVQAQAGLAAMKTEMRSAKEAREKRRQQSPSSEELTELIKESQFQKAEFKRRENSWKEQISLLQTQLEVYTGRIKSLKTARKLRSAALQQQLFKEFCLLNAKGESKDLNEIFQQTTQKVPPAGAGECAAPKLLQYAYCHQLQPMAMAEFWWGNSPKAEIRHHGLYYPACKGKCEPILKHMLQGLSVEDNPLLCHTQQALELEKVYEDNFLLVVNKQPGVLSVPGKEDAPSVYSWVKEQYPEATGPLIVHRLDMATSGLLLIAKTKEVHQKLQAQFEDRSIKKRYIALLDGIVTQPEGVIDLPICPNPLDRPRQVVDPIHGKTALTYYQVLARKGNQTRISFFPQTGRTHQLRVHAAHLQGLKCPITGDELYGKRADRLYLHAEALAFKHPASGEIIRIEKKAAF